MITILQEITDWDQHNGVYYVNDHDYLVGYRATLESEYKEFKSPMKRFSKARRKFIIVGTIAEDTDTSAAWQREVKGSKGNTYIVAVENGQSSCTCPGFKYRGQCKHLAIINEEYFVPITAEK